MYRRGGVAVGRLGRWNSASFDLFNPTQTHLDLRNSVQKFVKKKVEPQATEFDATETFNKDLFQQAADIGLLGTTIEEEYGGLGLDATAACILHEELSRSDPGFCLALLAHSMLFANNLARNGNEEQKRRFLPKACTGELIGGMAMSEQRGGTDVLGMKTSAVRDGDSWVLNGSKMWITNGTVGNGELGDVFLVYAYTDEDLSLFLVEKGTPGFEMGQHITGKCGMRASGTAELVFADCRIPAENLVGGEGNATRCMMRNLELERLTLGAMSVGIASRCVDDMTTYSKERQAFGSRLHQFGQIQQHIAVHYARMMAGKTYLYHTAGNLDLNKSGNRIATDGVKLFCSTMGKDAADAAVQVMGGNGYVAAYVVERLWRDAKLLEIGGGTLESHHKNITKELVR